MKLISPFPVSIISQHFGGNANPLYAGQGLKGHTGTDYSAAWGVAVKAAVSGPVAWIYNKNSPNLMNYRGVGQMVDGNDGFFYEVSYGHLSEIYVTEGQYVSAGDIIGRVGNTGACYVDQHLVTEAEKEAGSHAGAHLHFQVRKCVSRKSSKAGKDESLITNSTGAYTTSDERFVFAVDYNNGFNACVNPELFFTPVQTTSYFFTRDLYIGMSGEDVRELQKYLNKKGYTVSTVGAGSPGNETNIFGSKTQTALIALQKANGIQPAGGYFGAKTRVWINSHP